MAEAQVGTGWDTPVTNKIEEVALEQYISPPPTEGPDPRTGEVTAGAETVPGFRRAERAPVPEMAAAARESAPLRDIGEASFGPPPPVPETVHGVDDRIRITGTGAYPWRVHASLMITAADNSRWIGTGWFIGPRTLITAGHVVYIKNSGVSGRDGWVKSMEVIPGRNETDFPFGSVTADHFHSVTGWTENGDEEYDYGAIVLPADAPLGNKVGWFGYGVFPDDDLLRSVGNISGYPGDKPPGTQWYDNRQVASVSGRKVRYDIDTFGGQSGSAVYRIMNGQRYAVAIHAYGGATVNSGTRINVPVFHNLQFWNQT